MGATISEYREKHLRSCFLPAEPLVHAEIPKTDDKDRDQIAGIHVDVKKAGLKGQKQDAQCDAGQAN